MRCVWRAAATVAVLVVMAAASLDSGKEDEGLPEITRSSDLVKEARALQVPEEFEEDVVDTEPVEEARSQAQGRTFYEWGQSIMEWMGYDYDDDYYEDDYSYDYQLYYPQSGSSSGHSQIGYGLPAVGYVPSSSGGHQSSYSSYQPLTISAPHPQQHFRGSHHPARHDTFADDDEWSMSNILYNLGMAVVPMGLLLTAMPSGLWTFALRRRSLDSNLLEEDLEPSQLPLLHALMESEDVLALISPHCQRKLFCELSRIGELEQASPMQKAFYYVATLTPDFMARRVGLARLFRASRAGACNMFHCSATSGPTPPPLINTPPDTNHISEVAASPEQEVTEVGEQ